MELNKSYTNIWLDIFPNEDSNESYFSILLHKPKDYNLTRFEKHIIGNDISSPNANRSIVIDGIMIICLLG